MQFPRSALQGITWPAIPDHNASMQLAIMQQLEQSQWWTPEQLQLQQFRQLAMLLEHASKTVPFYKKYFQGSGYQPGDDLTPENWRCLPLLTRDAVQAAGKTILSTALPQAHGGTSVYHTVGRTGKHLKTVTTALTDLFWRAFTLRDHLWQQRDLSGRLAAIRVDKQGTFPPGGYVGDGWGAATDFIYKTGQSGVFNISTSLQQQLDWIRKFRPNYLLTYSSNADALARSFIEQGIDLPELREIRTISETLPKGIRETCRTAWDVPLVDLYSSEEMGYIALQCPEHEHYHIQSENVLVEILNENNQPCVPGEVGRVVVTSLHNYAMPLVRYDIQDYAEVGEPCSCGRGLPVIKHILGRERNILLLPNGEQRWPMFLGYDYFDELGVRQFQFIQRSLEQIEIHLVREQALNESEQAYLTRQAQSTFGYPFEIIFKVVDELPRNSNGKFESFLSEIV